MSSKQRITKEKKQVYLNFLMSEKIQKLLERLPNSSHLSFLRTELKNRFDIVISEPTQHRFIKQIEAGKFVEKEGKFYII
jgi:hypothetical protein